MTSSYAVDVSTDTFTAEVLEASRHAPVLVDFWAPWCAPCRTLGPLLERLADEYGGRFKLAKVNSDENLKLSQQFGVRSIPDVRVFRNGEQVDQFMGLLPERELRAFLDRIAPPPAEAERLRAAELRAAGDPEGALAALRHAVTLDPSHPWARIDLAEALLQTGEPDEAAQQLDGIRQNIDWDARVAVLKQGIAFRKSGGDETELAARVTANGSDLEARLALAGLYAGRQAWREALDQLLEIIRCSKGWRDGEARRQMLAIFDLGSADVALIAEYRRKLASALN